MAQPHLASGEITSLQPLGAQLRQTESHALLKSAQLEVLRIVLPAGNDTYYFQVSGALLPTPYSAYVYGAPHVDTNEGSNEDPIMAPPYFLGEEDGGALETIGDVDWWTVGSASSASEAVEFLAPGSAGIEVYVVTIDSESGPFPSGTVLNLAPGDLLRVESTLERAARGASGYYYFSPVPDPAATTADPVMAD